MIGARRGIAALALRAALVAAGALLTCGCNTTQQVAGVPEVPTDYRMRHPIAIREADRTLQMFIGSNRSELTPSQRAELLAFRRLAARRDRRRGGRSAGRRQQRARRRRRLARDPVDHRRQRRAAAGRRRAQLPGRGPHAGNDPRHLSEDRRASRTLRRMAGRHRAKLQPQLFREPADVPHWLRQPTQPRRHGRQPGRSGAAPRRDTRPTRCDARRSMGKVPAGRVAGHHHRSVDQCWQDKRHSANDAA